MLKTFLDWLSERPDDANVDHKALATSHRIKAKVHRLEFEKPGVVPGIKALHIAAYNDHAKKHNYHKERAKGFTFS